MSGPFAGLHAALVALFALVALSFLADPCGGGGDLCLGGYVGLLGLGIAIVGAVGIGIWLWRRRASPLLVWDSFVVAIGGFSFVSGGGGAATLLSLATLLALVLGVPAAVLAGREVARHRIERVVAFAGFATLFLLGVETGITVSVIGTIALGVGRLMSHEPAAAADPA